MGLRILCFPANQFGGQEPGTHDEIKTFIAQYGPHAEQFELFEKRDVNGANSRPVFVYCKSKIAGPIGRNIKWNFTKFLIDHQGKPVHRYEPPTHPLTFEATIQKMLEAAKAANGGAVPGAEGIFDFAADADAAAAKLEDVNLTEAAVPDKSKSESC